MGVSRCPTDCEVNFMILVSWGVRANNSMAWGACLSNDLPPTMVIGPIFFFFHLWQGVFSFLSAFCHDLAAFAMYNAPLTQVVVWSLFGSSQYASVSPSTDRRTWYFQRPLFIFLLCRTMSLTCLVQQSISTTFPPHSHYLLAVPN